MNNLKKSKLEYISIPLSPDEKRRLQQIAEERGLSISQMGKRAIQAFLYAIRHKNRHNGGS